MDKNLKLIELKETLSNRIENGEITLELNGHYPYYSEEQAIKELLTVNLFMVMFDFEKFSDKAIYSLEKIINNEESIEIPLFKANSLNSCRHCDQEHIFYFNGNKIWIKEDCLDDSPFTVSIPVPSGKLVIANDLREYFSSPDANVNTFSGLKFETEEYSKEYMFFSNVGNTSPSFAFKESNKNNKDFLEFGNWQTEVYNSETKTFTDIDNYHSNNILGSVCTDLWWFCAIDYDILKEKYKQLNKLKEFEDLIKKETVIDVKKGWYDCTSFYPSNYKEYNYDNDFVFSNMVWAKEIEDSFKIEFTKDKLKTEKEGIMNHPLINNSVDTEYASIRPSFSVLLADKFTSSFHYWDSEAKNIWFKDVPFTTKDENDEMKYTNYIEELNKVHSFDNIFSDMEFYNNIPVFKEKEFMAAYPESHFEHHSISDMNYGGWIGICYPYDIDTKELAFNLLIFKNLYLHKENEKIVKSTTDFESKVIFTLNMAYTNMKARNLKEEIVGIFKELTYFDNWEQLKGFSPSCKQSVYEEKLFSATQEGSLLKHNVSKIVDNALKATENIFNSYN